MFNAIFAKYADETPLNVAGLLITWGAEIVEGAEAGAEISKERALEIVGCFRILEAWGGEAMWVDFPGLIEAIGPAYVGVQGAYGGEFAEDYLGELYEEAAVVAEAAGFRAPFVW